MEISYFAREVMIFGLIFFFVGYMLYNFTIGDRDTPVKKHQ